MYKSHIPTYYNLNDYENWLNHLNKKGFVVIKDILTKDENDKATEQFKQDWKIVTPNFDWNNKETWCINNCPMVWGKGSVVFDGFGQSKFMWNLRTNPKIKEAFAKIYDTEDLAVSFDGLSVFLSPKQKSECWLHQDQRSSDKRLSIQGLVNLLKVGENDSGFVCVPGSHKTYIPVSSNRDWVVIDKNDMHYREAVKLIIPENCLTLWNSKTIHSNCSMNSKHINGIHLNRISAYITFMPKSRQTDDIIKKRISGYLNSDSTSHWSDRHEIKKVPFHIKKNYAERGFNKIKPVLLDGKIPEDYLKII